jgi:hypothetical protein
MKRVLWHLAALSLLGVLSNCVPDRGWRAPVPAASGAAPAYAVFLLGSLVIPPNLVVDGLTVGGLSDLVRVGEDTWRAIVDNEEDTPARVFDLRFRVTERGPAPLAGEKPSDVPRSVLRLAGLDGKSFDGEGLEVTPEGTLLVSSETEPSIREVSAEGETLRMLPVPPLFLTDKLAGRGARVNAGFEALALSPDGRTLWTANETALAQDAPDEARFATHPIRLLRYDSYQPAAQYVYVVEPIRRRTPGFSVRGLVDLVILPEGGLLALEREFVDGLGLSVQLFHVALDGATDVSGLESLAGQTYTPVKKTLLYDFARSGFVPDNLEGLAFGPDLPDGDRTLVVVSDNNFKALLQQTQIVALRLHSDVRGGS